MDKVNLYVYTNIKSNTPKTGGYGYLLEVTGNETKTYKDPVTLWKIEQVHDSSRGAELEAIRAALKRLTKPCEISLFGTVTNVMATFQNNWYKTWHDSGWLNSKGEPIKNTEDWQEIYNLLEKHTIVSVSLERHSYSSWFENQLEGKISDSIEEQENVINTIHRAKTEIQRALESVENTDFFKGEIFRNSVSVLVDLLFSKMEIGEKLENNRVVIIQNETNAINTKHSEDGEIIIKSASGLNTESEN